MSLKAQAAGVAIGIGVIVIGLWYVKRQASGALSAAGDAIVSGADSVWSLGTTPVIDFGGGTVATVANNVGNGIVSTPTSTLDGISFGTLLSGTGAGGNLGWLDTLKSGPLGGLVGTLSGDGNSNIFGPAPSAGIDLGTGANDWSS